MEKALAKKELEQLLRDANIDSKEHRIIALFRNARYEKKIADSWWIEFVDTLLEKDKNIVIIDILSPDIPTKLNKKVLEYSNKDLRGLASFFDNCDNYISADTGPMHLAGSCDVDVIALFNQTSPESFGPLGKNSKTIDIDKLSAKDVAKLV